MQSTLSFCIVLSYFWIRACFLNVSIAPCFSNKWIQTLGIPLLEKCSSVVVTYLIKSWEFGQFWNSFVTTWNNLRNHLDPLLDQVFGLFWRSRGIGWSKCTVYLFIYKAEWWLYRKKKLIHFWTKSLVCDSHGVVEGIDRSESTEAAYKAEWCLQKNIWTV